jgi:hypothetical protein
MQYINLGDVRHTQISQEIVELAGKHTSVSVRYDHLGEGHHKADIFIDNNADDIAIGAFWEEFDRLQKLINKPLDEPILDDDHPVHVGYMYTVDGKPTECPQNFGTVARWKFQCGEVRRCDIYGRQARQPLEKEEPTTMSLVMVNSSSSKSNSRKKKKTYKIRKSS